METLFVLSGAGGTGGTVGVIVLLQVVSCDSNISVSASVCHSDCKL